MTALFTQDEILKQLTTDPTKGFIDRLAAGLRAQNFDLDEIIDLTFHPDKQVSFRAAWLLDTMVVTAPEVYVNNLPYFVQRFSDVTDASCKRHYTRMMMHLTAPNSPQIIQNKLKGTDLEQVVETCFDWLIDSRVKVAVKVFAADTLFNLCDRYGWIKEELTSQVQFMMRDGSPAIQSRGEKLLALIQSQKSQHSKPNLSPVKF